ncbi:hypothetical protein [Streptomyces sp. bgisy022]|uniref:hypothetical protein n=1 Tax=Streptomyces sp. bgisy022 TaxID=3413769 RepID=UPI003D727CC7
MPHNVRIWVEDCADSRFNVYIDSRLVTPEGAQALEKILTATVRGWRRLDDITVYRALRTVTG